MGKYNLYISPKPFSNDNECFLSKTKKTNRLTKNANHHFIVQESMKLSLTIPYKNVSNYYNNKTDDCWIDFEISGQSYHCRISLDLENVLYLLIKANTNEKIINERENIVTLPNLNYINGRFEIGSHFIEDTIDTETDGIDIIPINSLNEFKIYRKLDNSLILVIDYVNSLKEKQKVCLYANVSDLISHNYIEFSTEDLKLDFENVLQDLVNNEGKGVSETDLEKLNMEFKRYEIYTNINKNIFKFLNKKENSIVKLIKLKDSTIAFNSHIGFYRSQSDEKELKNLLYSLSGLSTSYTEEINEKLPNYLRRLSKALEIYEKVFEGNSEWDMLESIMHRKPSSYKNFLRIPENLCLDLYDDLNSDEYLTVFEENLRNLQDVNNTWNEFNNRLAEEYIRYLKSEIKLSCIYHMCLSNLQKDDKYISTGSRKSFLNLYEGFDLFVKSKNILNRKKDILKLAVFDSILNKTK